MKIRDFFDQATSTWTYVVYDETSRDAVIIDPVLDYNPHSGRISTKSVDSVSAIVNEMGLRVHLILETHAHADHLTGAQMLKEKFPGANIAIGSRIVETQQIFKGIFNLPEHFKTDGSQFDLLLENDREYSAGSLKFKVLHTPGHTPACASYVFGEGVFVGDAVFMPEVGTGRCDFLGGSAETLFDSIQKIYALSDSTRLYVGHDYPKEGQAPRSLTTVGAEKMTNIQLKSTTSRQEFVTLRNARDKTLDAPKLLLPSIQVNIAAGALPPKDRNGVSYLRIPLSGV